MIYACDGGLVGVGQRGRCMTDHTHTHTWIREKSRLKAADKKASPICPGLMQKTGTRSEVEVAFSRSTMKQVMVSILGRVMVCGLQVCHHCW